MFLAGVTQSLIKTFHATDIAESEARIYRFQSPFRTGDSEGYRAVDKPTKYCLS